MMIDIEYLDDNMLFAPVVAKWIFDEFINGIRRGVSYDQVLLSFKQCHKTELPVRFIAKAGNKCVGAVSIVHNDLAYKDYTPWLASLYVDKEYRNNKIGERLIERVKSISKELGFKEIYLRTEHAGNYYRRLGWQFIESCTDEFELNTEVFMIALV